MTARPWPLRSYLELGALPTAVPCARLHARHLVWEWGLNDLAESTELLVSELVTNAVKATAVQGDQTALRLQLSSDNVRVLIEVWDADPQPPVPKGLGDDGTSDPQEEGGRGLFLVAALSTRWDWYLTQEPTGKVVWCELDAELPAPSEGAQSVPQALLPRRVPHEQQKRPIEVMSDPNVLRKIRDRLRDPTLAGMRSGALTGMGMPAAWVLVMVLYAFSLSRITGRQAERDTHEVWGSWIPFPIGSAWCGPGFNAVPFGLPDG